MLKKKQVMLMDLTGKKLCVKRWRTVSLVMLLAFVFTLSAVSSATAMNRDFLICAGHFDKALKSGSMSVLDLAPIAVKHGAKGVEYRDVYWKDKAKELPAVREQLKKMNLIATYTTVVKLYDKKKVKQDQLLQDIKDTKALGSSLLRVQVGARPDGSPAGAAIRKAAKSAVELAEKLGVKLAMENTPKAPGQLISDIKATLEEFNSPMMGTNIDFANYAVTGQDYMEAINALSKWIIYVHAKDVKKTDKGMKSTYLGDGYMPMKKIIDALDATGRKFIFCFEFPGGKKPEDRIVKSKAFLTKLGY